MRQPSSFFTIEGRNGCTISIHVGEVFPSENLAAESTNLRPVFLSRPSPMCSIQPEVCNPFAEWAAAGEATKTFPATRGELRPGNSSRTDGGMGGSWLSLVGAAEGALAYVDAVDPQTLSSA